MKPFTDFPYERHIRNFCAKFLKPGDTVYDIGANLGLHTILFEKLCTPQGRIYAFEPNPGLVKSLQATFATAAGVDVLGHALGSDDTTMNLFIPDEDHAQASLGNWTGQATACSVPG